MRIRATALLVAGVAVLALAATIDALRGDGDEKDPERPRPATTTTGPTATESAAQELERAGVSGTLYLTIRSGPGCDYRATALPSLESAGSGFLQRCRFAVSPDGRRVAEVATCPDNRASLVRNLLNPEVADAFRGCSAAWKPGGAFTYVSGGAVVVASIDCLGAAGCLRVVIPRDAVARGVRRIGPGLDPASVAQIEWLTASRLAVVVRIDRDTESIVLFERRRPIQTVDPTVPPHSHLEVDADRKEIHVGGRGLGGFFTFNFNGGFVDGDRIPFGDAAAIAYSPDGRWLALARPGNVCIYPRVESDFPVGCIEGDAQDLAWR
jgi:hypothetical protein